MAKAAISTKRVAITQANAQMVATVAIASFVAVFCLMASKAVLSTNLYEAKVITKEQTAKNQLRENIDAYNTLLSSYKKFTGKSQNIIGGAKTGTGDNDGDNAKIILDSLPYKYDFPALTASIEKILNDQGLKISTITGTDDQVNQQANVSSTTPQPVEMPFSFSISHASHDSVNQMIKSLLRSIRPIQIDTLTISGGGTDMTATVTAHTYYQPAKAVNITQQVVK